MGSGHVVSLGMGGDRSAGLPHKRQTTGPSPPCRHPPAEGLRCTTVIQGSQHRAIWVQFDLCQPLFCHESCVLVATPFIPSRGPFGPSVGEASGAPARVHHLLRPLLTSASRSGNLAGPSVHADTMQISRGKLDRLHRTPAESTILVLVDEDFAEAGPLVRPGCLIFGFCSSGRGFASALLSDGPSREPPLRLASPLSHQT